MEFGSKYHVETHLMRTRRVLGGRDLLKKFDLGTSVGIDEALYCLKEHWEDCRCANIHKSCQSLWIVPFWDVQEHLCQARVTVPRHPKLCLQGKRANEMHVMRLKYLSLPLYQFRKHRERILTTCLAIIRTCTTIVTGREFSITYTVLSQINHWMRWQKSNCSFSSMPLPQAAHRSLYVTEEDTIK